MRINNLIPDYTIHSEWNKAYIPEVDEDGSKECFGWFEDSGKILMDEFGDSSAQYIRKSSQKHKIYSRRLWNTSTKIVSIHTHILYGWQL